MARRVTVSAYRSVMSEPSGWRRVRFETGDGGEIEMEVESQEEAIVLLLDLAIAGYLSHAPGHVLTVADILPELSE